MTMKGKPEDSKSVYEVIGEMAWGRPPVISKSTQVIYYDKRI